MKVLFSIVHIEQLRHVAALKSQLIRLLTWRIVDRLAAFLLHGKDFLFGGSLHHMDFFLGSIETTSYPYVFFCPQPDDFLGLYNNPEKKVN